MELSVTYLSLQPTTFLALQGAKNLSVLPDIRRSNTKLTDLPEAIGSSLGRQPSSLFFPLFWVLSSAALPFCHSERGRSGRMKLSGAECDPVVVSSRMAPPKTTLCTAAQQRAPRRAARQGCRMICSL